MKPLALMLFTAFAAQAATVQLCLAKFTLIDNSALMRGHRRLSRGPLRRLAYGSSGSPSASARARPPKPST